MTAAFPPQAARAEPRLKPTRAGIINLWDYLDEEFVFADGRLVLRGHNGSGKTKALEVLFPFVLDGSLDAKRLDPFSGQNRTMKSNLLYRGQDSEHGYVWMEFARALDDGTVDIVTLVIGLVQHKDKDRPQTSFYVTDKRLGVEFGLLGADSRPLTRKQLIGRLGRASRLESKTEYQDAVDGRLFGLGRERYTQLLDLLISLRRPLLAKDLDPVKVSATLSAGLSPVDEGLIDQAARDFDNLKAVQDEYAKLAAADKAVGEFVGEYRTYLRRYGRRQVDLTRERMSKAAAAVDAVSQAVAEQAAARDDQEKADLAFEDAKTQVRVLDGRLGALKGKFEGYKDLIREAEQLEKDRKRLDADAQRIGRARVDLEQLKQESEAVEDALAEERGAAERFSIALSEAAYRAFPDPGDDLDDADGLEVSTKARTAARAGEIREVRALIADVESAGTLRVSAQENADGAQSDVQDAQTQLAAAEAAAEAERAAVREALSVWAAEWSGTDEHVVMRSEESAVLVEAVAELDMTAGNLIAEAYDQLTGDRRTTAVAAAVAARNTVTEVETTIETFTAEREAIAGQRDEAPATNDLRPADRAGRPGAPLWELVRFADHVDDATAAGVEGALYGAGLLTAWIHPDAALTTQALQDHEADGYLTERAGPAPGVRTALDVLVPEDHPAVTHGRISSVLAGIALTDDLVGDRSHHTAVTTHGGFVVGALAGSRPKDKPEFIGATNRSRRREVRLAQLDEKLRHLDEELKAARGRLAAVEEFVRDFSRARDALPTIKGLADRLSKVQAVASLLTAANIALSRATHQLNKAISAVATAERELRRGAAQRSLPTAADLLNAVSQAVADFGAAVTGLISARAKAKELQRQLTERAERIGRRELEVEDELEALQTARAEHLAETAEYEARRKVEGVGYEQVQTEIADVGQRLTAAKSKRKEAETSAKTTHDTLILAVAKQEHTREQAAESLTELATRLSEFEAAANPDLRPLLGIAVTALWPTPPSGDELGKVLPSSQVPDSVPTSGLDRIRAVLPAAATTVLDAYHAALPAGRVAEATVAAAAERAWESFRHLELALKSGEDGYQAEISPHAPFAVYIDSGDGRAPVGTAAKKIAEDLEAQAVLLEDKERAVLEDSLLTGIARQIHGRVRRARDLVKEMDADTKSKPMSSGTKIGIGWVRSDKADEHQVGASEILKADPLGPDDNVRLRTLIRTMLRNHLDRHPRDTYREALAVVLDYRTWYNFELKLFRPGGPKDGEKLTSKRHSEMSGGEKSAAIHLPLFAAANALYSSGRRHSPRMIALDEAFSGIDGNFTPELLGLTVKFDLDLFMTGHDLWVSDAAVPMASHYDMHHDEATHTVSSLLLLWDGEQIIDAGAGFSGNHELEAEVLGFLPTRHIRADSNGDGLAFEDSTDTDEDEDGDDEP